MAEVPTDDGWMEPALRKRLSTMRFTKRRDEAQLGRWTAKTTIAHALSRPLDAASLEGIRIVNAPDGAPEVTVDGRAADMVIGMTDRADWAVCTVLEGRDRVGCDLELVEPRSKAFMADYFTAAEQRWCADTGPDWNLAANLVWSAKESALKVLRTGLRRDTRTVEVAAGDIAGAPSGAWHPLAVRTREGDTFPGWWVRHGEFVLTAVAAVPTDQPRSLVEPAPLRSAIPAHAWMENLLSR